MNEINIEMDDMSSGSKKEKLELGLNKSQSDSQNQEQSSSPSTKITYDNCYNILVKIGFVIVILLTVYVIISLIASILYLFYIVGLGIPEPPYEKVKISYSNNDEVRFKLENKTYDLEVVNNMFDPLYPMRQTYFIGRDDNKKRVNFQRGKLINAYKKDGKYYTHYACVLEQNFYECEDLTSSFIAFALDKITVLFGISLINAVIIAFILVGVILICFLGGCVVCLLAMCIRALCYYIMYNRWPQYFWVCDEYISKQRVNNQQ